LCLLGPELAEVLLIAPAILPWRALTEFPWHRVAALADANAHIRGAILRPAQVVRAQSTHIDALPGTRTQRPIAPDRAPQHEPPFEWAELRLLLRARTA
jgi:hypothetical protein